MNENNNASSRGAGGSGGNLGLLTAPRRASYVVEKVFWECNVLNHRHATELAAARCIATRSGDRGRVIRMIRNLRLLDCFIEVAALEAAGGTVVPDWQERIADTEDLSFEAAVIAVGRLLKEAAKWGPGPFQAGGHAWKLTDLLDPGRQSEIRFLRKRISERMALETAVFR